jgi:hypothetical protein
VFKDVRVKFHEATHIVGQLYGVPRGILRAIYTIFYDIEFQNHQIFQQTISLFREQSTVVLVSKLVTTMASEVAGENTIPR